MERVRAASGVGREARTYLASIFFTARVLSFMKAGPITAKRTMKMTDSVGLLPDARWHAVDMAV